MPMGFMIAWIHDMIVACLRGIPDFFNETPRTNPSAHLCATIATAIVSKVPVSYCNPTAKPSNVAWMPRANCRMYALMRLPLLSFFSSCYDKCLKNASFLTYAGFSSISSEHWTFIGWTLQDGELWEAAIVTATEGQGWDRLFFICCCCSLTISWLFLPFKAVGCSPLRRSNSTPPGCCVWYGYWPLICRFSPV